MMFITIPNHKTLSLTLDPNTTTLHSLKLSLYHYTHIPIHHLHQLYLSQSHPLPSQNDAILLSRLCVVLDGPFCFRNHFPQPALQAQMPGYEARIGYDILHSVLRWNLRWGSICGRIQVRRSTIGLDVGWRERDCRFGFAYRNENL